MAPSAGGATSGGHGDPLQAAPHVKSEPTEVDGRPATPPLLKVCSRKCYVAIHCLMVWLVCFVLQGYRKTGGTGTGTGGGGYTLLLLSVCVQ